VAYVSGAASVLGEIIGLSLFPIGSMVTVLGVLVKFQISWNSVGYAYICRHSSGSFLLQDVRARP
jgi:hypothetical protein